MLVAEVLPEQYTTQVFSVPNEADLKSATVEQLFSAHISFFTHIITYLKVIFGHLEIPMFLHIKCKSDRPLQE